MRTVKGLMGLAGLAGVLMMLGAARSDAAPPFPVPQGPPVWCYGQVDDECRLFLGTELTCRNVEPCFAFLSASPGGGTETPDLGGKVFCLGEVDDRCMLLLGTEEACENVTPCLSRNGQLPRAPRTRPR